ncbi:MAG: DASS family sodium-coupled anion symporter [Verrucomicrobiota bacterium]
MTDPCRDLKNSSISPAQRTLRYPLIIAALIGFAAIQFGFPLDPNAKAMAGLDPHQVRTGLAIFAFIGFLWLTEALPLTITALLVPLLACCSGLMEVKPSLVGFADPLIFLFLGGFAIAAALSAQGLDQWLAHRILHLGKGSFIKVSYLLFGATALISMWVSNTATTAMMLPLALGILRRHPSPRNSVYLLLGTAYSANVGGIGTIVGSPPNGIAAAQLGIGFTEWMRFGLPAMVALMPLMIIILRLICRPEAIAIPPVREPDFRFTRDRKLTLGIFAATAACWIASASLAKAIGISGSFDTLIALAGIVALTVTRVVDWKQIERNTDWGVLLLFGGGITLSTILGESGTSEFMARVFAAFTADWSPLAVTGATVLFIIFLSELASNTALAALMVPLFFTIAVELGMTPASLVLPLTIAASCSFMMPVGTPPNALAFATGEVPQRQMLRVGLVLNLAFTAALVLLSKLLF